MSEEQDRIKSSHVAAARLRVAIGKRTGEEVPPWIRDLASRDLTVPANPRPGPEPAPADSDDSESPPSRGAIDQGQDKGAARAPADPDSAAGFGDVDEVRAAYRRAQELYEQGEVAHAADTYQRIIDSGHREYAPLASFLLGRMQDQQGDAAGADAAYRQAMDSGYSDVVALAATN